MGTLSVFVSSPGDVALERESARKTLDQLSHEYRRQISLEPYFWEYEPMDFSQGYQPQIPKASEYDIVVAIFFSRIGTPLTIDGQQYPSGTAYELIEAKTAKQKRIHDGGPASPIILVFVNRSDPQVSLRDEVERDRRIHDWKTLNGFLDEHTRDGNEFIGAVNQYETLSEFQDKLESKLRSFIEQRLAVPRSGVAASPVLRPDWEGNPFCGLSAFEFEQAPIYFGRSEATGAVITAFQSQAAQNRPRFVLISGASGSGKSSLARAGVLPTLIKSNVIQGVGLWRRAVMKPSDAGGDLFAALAKALLAPAALPELGEDGTSPAVLTERWRAAPDVIVESLRGALRQAAVGERQRQVHLLQDQVLQFRKTGHHRDADACAAVLKQGLALPLAKLVLLVDQFEETYTAKLPEQQVTAFTRCLRLLAEASDGPVFIVMTLPSAFYGNALEDEHLRELTKGDGLFGLPAPTDVEFAQMIRLPAQAAGLEFETQDGQALDERLLADARSNPDCLPLLEFCLEELTNRCDGDGLLTHQVYDNLGTLSGVLAKRARETLKELPQPVQDALDLVLPALIARDPNQLQVAVRRAAPWNEFESKPEAQALLQAFVKARLLVRDEQHVSVAHEALLRNWDRAQEWIGLDENQDFLRRRERLEQSYKTWRDAHTEHRRQFLLPSGIQLAEAQDLVVRHPHAFQPMQEFVQASVRQHRVRQYRLVAVVFTVMLAVFGYYLYSTQRRADAAAAGQLIAEAAQNLSLKNFPTAEILLAKALTLQDSAETRSELLRARGAGIQYVSGSPQVSPRATLSTFSRDGKLLTVVEPKDASVGCSLLIVETAGRAEVARIELSYLPECLAFDRTDGPTRNLACARPDHSVEIWSVQITEKSATPFRAAWGTHEKRVPSLAFHPSEPYLAVCSEDKTLRLWDYSVETPRLLWERKNAHGTAIHGIAFNADGSLLASGGGDYLVKVWDLEKAIKDPHDATQPFAPQYELAGHTDSVFAVAFSPDGTKMASGGYDRVVRIWDLAIEPQRPNIRTLYGHEGTVLDLDFGRDGRLLVSGSKDETARLWDVLEGRILLTVPPSCGVIRSVAFLKFGDQSLYCGGEAGWSLWAVGQRDEATRLWNAGATVNAVAYDPQGEFLAAGGTDGTVRLWDSDYRLVTELNPDWEGDAVNGIAIDPQGRWLAAAGEGHRVHVWDRHHDWRKVEAVLEHDGPVWGLCFDTQGAWLASGNADKNICIKQWGTDRWALQNTFGQSSDSIYALACLPDGKSLVSGDAKANVIVRDAATGFERSRITNVTEGECNVWSLAVCPDPRAVLSGNSNGRVYRWDPDSPGTPLGTSDEDADINHTVNSVSYSSVRRWIAAGGDGRSVEIYDLDLKKRFSLFGQDGTVWMVAFSPDGNHLAYGGLDRIVQVWHLEKVLRTRERDTPRQLFEESQQATGLTVEDRKVVSLRRAR